MNDLKFAFRQLLKSPGFTAGAVLTLALGIGATSTVFSLIQGVLLTPPPYATPDRLALITAARTDGQPYTRGWPAAQWQEWQKQSKTFEAIAAYGWTFNFLILPDGSESMEGMRVTTDYFKVLGVQPTLGRAFDDADTLPENSTSIIIGDDLWRRRFKADPSVIGQTLQISRSPNRHTIVGVMPPNVRFLPSPNVAQEPNYNVDAKVDYWLPARILPRDLKVPGAYIVGRLRPNISLREGQTEITALTARQARDDQDFAGITANVQSLESYLNREGRSLLLPVAGAVALVFLVACGNAAGLLLARGLQRQHEYALRAALGARPMQLCRPVLLESLLLALLGGLAGAGLAVGCLDGLKLIAGAAIPRLDVVRLDWRVLAFCLSAAGVAGLLAGALPAWRAIGRDPVNELKAGSRTASAGHTERRLLGGVAAVQIALTLALLVGASLLIQTVRSLAKIRPGFDTRNILTMSVTSVGTNSRAFHLDAVERVARLPGVKAAAFGWGVPLTGNSWSSPIAFEGQPEPRSEKDRPVLPIRSVTPDYFQALGLKLVEGRAFRATDTGGAPRVAIVNQTAATRFFPGTSAVGKKFANPSSPTNYTEIIGVLADTRTVALTAAPEPEVYVSFWQSSAFSKHLVLRVEGEPRTVATSVQRELRAIEPTVSVENIKSLEEIRADSVASRTFAMNLLTGFALVACLLATAGIYGVLSLAANSRRTELAIRMAIGAQRSDVLRLILASGLRLAVVGISLGLGIALALAAGLRTYLFGISPADPLTLAGMVVVVLTITLGACALPAWRAARVEPLSALRNE